MICCFYKNGLNPILTFLLILKALADKHSLSMALKKLSLASWS